MCPKKPQKTKQFNWKTHFWAIYLIVCCWSNYPGNTLIEVVHILSHWWVKIHYNVAIFSWHSALFGYTTKLCLVTATHSAYHHRHQRFTSSSTVTQQLNILFEFEYCSTENREGENRRESKHSYERQAGIPSWTELSYNPMLYVI